MSRRKKICGTCVFHSDWTGDCCKNGRFDYVDYYDKACEDYEPKEDDE